MSDWLYTCDEVGGPSYPPVDDCMKINDGCEAFKDGFCLFDHDYIITNFENLLDAPQCQAFCGQLPGCVFFYHDR